MCFFGFTIVLSVQDGHSGLSLEICKVCIIFQIPLVDAKFEPIFSHLSTSRMESVHFVIKK